ncbi:SET domain-containing protein-lysine N-methyltransferase [Gemmata sp. JC673]|uniref:SET domain-containing protein-lysine N-methyltransferase n=1 Tax=Gemmata algarum TaxID=2975278 RepID=A0ABU5EX30_9BACT|nr:SET domain-containing protein-lysine N-methyltransferase [Gemmata algarum]MDY3558388.1 SET domain-containing protein-lysine N-methyltransferase [Gemmata algarum]
MNEPPALYVWKVRGMGRGVFAGRAYRAGEVIEVCPVVRIPTYPKGPGGKPLEHYVFEWDAGTGELAIALGYGSLYNHSPEPNARFNPRASREDIVFRALRDIEAGEQIFVDYRWDASHYERFRKAS